MIMIVNKITPVKILIPKLAMKASVDRVSVGTKYTVSIDSVPEDTVSALLSVCLNDD
jgi:hypothetical protein